MSDYWENIIFFKPEEFDTGTVHGDKDEGSGFMHMDEDFIHKLECLREVCVFPFIITSGYRSPEYNDYVSHTGTSGPHTTGHAVDIKVSGEDALIMISLARQHGFTGIGIKQKGDYAHRFVHLDDLPYNSNRPRPHVWTY